MDVVIMGVRIGSKENFDSKVGVRFATYNMMFGMYGREGVINAMGHFAFHGVKSPLLTRLFSRFSVRTVDIVSRSGADFICFNEVLGTLRGEEIRERLKQEGYEYFCWGAAEHHNKPLDLGTLLASKYPFEELNFTLPQEPHMGGGGGACAVYVKEFNLSILAVHLARDEELQKKQVKAISVFVKNQSDLKRKVVVMGDFNLNVEELMSYEQFSDLNLAPANGLGTAPEIDEIKMFEFQAWDNIFYKGLNLNRSGRFRVLSDHLGVWADFKL
jgi:endonuclease/exonuclease/phosphatase family metal-dependent hydrolase